MCETGAAADRVGRGAVKLPWHEAGPPNHHDDKVGSDKQVQRRIASDVVLRLYQISCLQVHPKPSTLNS